VLVPFPFTDLTAEKLRPAVIVSPDPQELDVVIAFISSIVPNHPHFAEYKQRPPDGDLGPAAKATGVVFSCNVTLLHTFVKSLSCQYALLRCLTSWYNSLYQDSKLLKSLFR